MAWLGRGEGMVHGRVPLCLFVKFKHREINHPQRAPAGFNQTIAPAKLTVSDLDAQGTNRVIHHLGPVGAKENQVAILRLRSIQKGAQSAVVNILDDRALQPIASKCAVIDLDVGQALGPVDLDELGVSINFTPAQAAVFTRATRNTQTDHTSVLHGGGTRENFEIDIGHDIGQFGQLKLDPQVRLIRTVLAHRLGIGHHWKLAQIDLQGGLKHGLDHVLEQVANVLLAQKRGFNVDLCEFRLAVSAQIFVPEALGDLVITVKAGDHEQLLEQLGALWQRKKVPIMHAAGYQVVARALGCRLAQHRRLDIHKTMGIKKFTHLHGYAVAQHQVVLHVGAAQIQHPVRQARGLAEVVVVKLERRRDRGVEHSEFMTQHLDAAALELLVAGALGAGTHQTLDLNTKLIAQPFGGGEHLRPVGVTDHLNIALSVA